jgi:hypothetical protein
MLDSGKEFDEPLDWKNPKTGQLESTILESDGNPFVMITARRTNSVGDDPDDFMWLGSPADSEYIKGLQDDIAARDRNLLGLRVELENALKMMHEYKAQGDASGSEANSLRVANASLWLETSTLRLQVEAARNRLRAAAALTIQTEAAIEALIADARSRGLELAKGPLERAIDSIQAVRKMQEEAKFALPKGTAPESELVAMKKKDEDLAARIAKLEEERTAAGKAKPAEATA